MDSEAPREVWFHRQKTGGWNWSFDPPTKRNVHLWHRMVPESVNADLLAALRRSLNWCVAAGMDGTGECVEPEWCEQARAAIAKAEGK